MSNPENVIAIVGGTGLLGSAIARRLVKAGYSVVIGSRSADRAQAKAAELAAEFGCTVYGTTYSAAADAAHTVVVTVPYASQAATLGEIRHFVQDKVVLDTTVPLMPPRVMRVQLPESGCAAVSAQGLLGPGVRVVSAFHNVAAHKLATDAPVDCDVLVFGDDRASRQMVIGLVEACGLRGLHGGALVNSAAAEALTSVLISINKVYAVDGAGLKITGELQSSTG